MVWGFLVKLGNDIFTFLKVLFFKLFRQKENKSPMLLMYEELNSGMTKHQFNFHFRDNKTGITTLEPFEFIRTLDYAIDDGYYCEIRRISTDEVLTVSVSRVFFKLKYAQPINFTKKICDLGLYKIARYVIILEYPLLSKIEYKILVFREDDDDKNCLPTNLKYYHDVLGKSFPTIEAAEKKGWEEIDKQLRALYKKANSPKKK